MALSERERKGKGSVLGSVLGIDNLSSVKKLPLLLPLCVVFGVRTCFFLAKVHLILLITFLAVWMRIYFNVPIQNEPEIFGLSIP